MSGQPGIPRATLIWLLVAQALVILPHLGHLPTWIVPLWLACAAWRVQVLRMRLDYPGRLAKVGLILAVGLGVFYSRGRLVGLDAAVVLLVAVFILKVLEMRARRDALVLIFLGFFVVLTSYLFESGLGAALFSLLPVTVLVAALIGLASDSQAARTGPTLRLAAGMLAQALPLMLLLFVLFPRLGPLWSLPAPSERGVTGLAESMSPNDIAELSRSDKLAFRAVFSEAPPPRSQLYWRALTMEHFDGRRWNQHPQPPPDTPLSPQGPSLDYQIIMQPSGKPWLFALDLADSRTPEVRRLADDRLQRRQPVDTAFLYSVRSWPQAPRGVEQPVWLLRRNLQLPELGEPRTRAWARELRQQHVDDGALVAALLRHFNREPFVYTLRPPVLGENAIDAFLFETRRGFCAHYAGAMVFVLRAAGIPARVVAGYQGGEIGPGERTLQVRQFDAHAWVEYWQPGRGWISVDPTFQVAPQRIEMGLEAAVAGEESFLEDSPFSPLRYRQVGWINQLRLSMDQLDHVWSYWVLNYQAERQQGLLERWFGRDYQRGLAITLIGLGALLIGALSLWLLKPWRDRPAPQQRLWRAFEQALGRAGIGREPAEGPRDFARRAAERLPEQRVAILDFAECYLRLQYAGEAADLATLRQRLRTLQGALPRRFGRRPE